MYVTPNNKDNTKFNIYNRNFGTQKELINDLITSKVFLVPGHKAELFCIAAEEARELCIPTVTLGIGSLSERIIHNKTGFIAKNEKDFSSYFDYLLNVTVINIKYGEIVRFNRMSKIDILKSDDFKDLTQFM